VKHSSLRVDGYAPIRDYAAIRDGAHRCPRRSGWWHRLAVPAGPRLAEHLRRSDRCRARTRALTDAMTLPTGGLSPYRELVPASKASLASCRCAGGSSRASVSGQRQPGSTAAVASRSRSAAATQSPSALRARVRPPGCAHRLDRPTRKGDELLPEGHPSPSRDKKQLRLRRGLSPTRPVRRE
jgi:hypothetical protein